MSRTRNGKTVKQISIFLPISDWRLLSEEASRRKSSITEIGRQSLKPLLDQLRDDPEQRARDAGL